jgi:hypothetical protein
LRHAIYWAPEPDHPLWKAGCEWIGRDASSSDVLPVAAPNTAVVTEPARYGFHATLKAPFELRADADPVDFAGAVEKLAASTRRFSMPTLVVARLQDFLALCPLEPLAPSHPLRQLADRCVRQLDPWRLPPSKARLERRIAGLDADSRQWTYALRWGYPYVFDAWRFHMTLSNSMAEIAAMDESARLLHEAADRHFANALAVPSRCESVCVFVEPERGAQFVLTHRFALAE